jgi:hypothetical protein
MTLTKDGYDLDDSNVHDCPSKQTQALLRSRALLLAVLTNRPLSAQLEFDRGIPWSR